MADHITASVPTDCSQQMEELLAIHKRQKKELQGRLLAVRKSFTKPDKKTKKELSEQAELEEKELVERQQQELADLVKRCSIQAEEQNSRIDSSKNPQQQQQLPPSTDQPQTNSTSTDPVDHHHPAAKQRVSKAQRRRDRKAERSRERESRIAEAEIENVTGPRRREFDAIADKLANESCQVKLIPSDGNCMYAAVCDQLESTHTVDQLRQMTAAEMIANQQKYQCFLAAGDAGGSTLNDSQYEEHVRSVANTTAWGGQVELAALSAALGRQVRVLQADAPDVILGGVNDPDQSQSELNDPSAVITLTYHRHMYRLGAHYNSIQRINPDSDHTEVPEQDNYR